MSLTPSALGAVKAMLLDLDARKVEALLRPMVENPPADRTIREELEAFAAAEGLQL
jgi:phosphotransferase system enzyme I (PtsP)